MKAATFIQPWASAVFYGKDVENREKRPPQGLVGRRFAIHAGMKDDTDDRWNLLHQLERQTRAPTWFQTAQDRNRARAVSRTIEALAAAHRARTLPRGALVGTVRLLGFVNARGEGEAVDDAHWARLRQALTSRWRAPGSRWHWVLEEPLMLATPIPCQGALGLWNVPPVHVPALEALEHGVGVAAGPCVEPAPGGSSGGEVP